MMRPRSYDQPNNHEESSLLSAPLLIGLGCRRCGSSWLHRILNQKSGICKPENGVHFFSEHYSRGKSWYEIQFPEFRDGDTRVDLSVSYLYPEYYASVSERLKTFSSGTEVKLFAVLRNPVDRAFSDYLRGTRVFEVPENMKFEDAIDRYPEFLQRGLYGKMLAPFYESFGNEKIKILFYDDLEKDPKAYLNELFGFMGLVNDLEDAVMVRLEPKGKQLGNKGLTKAILKFKTAFDSLARRMNFFEEWEAFKFQNLGLYLKALSLNERSTVLGKKTRIKLMKYYEKDIQQLEELTGCSLESWR